MRSTAAIRALSIAGRTTEDARNISVRSHLPTVHAALLVAITASSFMGTTAEAQPAPRSTSPVEAPTSRTPVPSPTAAETKTVPDMMAARPGGITADHVASRAAATSYQAKAAEETAAAASARAEQSWTNFLPRVAATGRYTRLSEFTPPSLGPTIGRIPVIFDNWVAQATLAIPVSDYFLKINKAYTASTHQEEAARYDVITARAKSYSDGKIAYFTWLRARGAVTVAEQSLAVSRAHLKDAENQFAVGNASKADVLRAQTSVAASELVVERARSSVVIAERQVRVATHAKDDEKLEPGESLDGPLSTLPPDATSLVGEAHGARPEIKSIDKNAEAARKLASVASAAKYPALSGFGDVTYANPNTRRFPQTADWFPTWSLGAQITWSPNDLIAAGPASSDATSRAAALDAQKAATRDGIELEVTQTYQAVVEADASIGTTTRQLESAEEGYRVARELFNAGRGTGTTLVDAETALAQARFEHLDAKVNARIARIRLDHALGHDVK